jgi:hypothetical protein
VHDHEAEIVREGVRDEEPRAGQVLEPDLRLVRVPSIHQGQPPVLHLGIDVEGCYVLPSEKLIHTLLLLFFDLLGCPLLVRCLLLLANRGEFELLHGYALDVAELVEVHGAEREYLIVFLNLPVETEAIGYLEEGLVVVWQEVGPILLLPLEEQYYRLERCSLPTETAEFESAVAFK